MHYPLPNFQSASKMFLRTKSSASHSLGGRERAGHHDICFSFIWSKCYTSTCYLFFKISIHQMQSFIYCPAHDSDSYIIYLYNPKNPINSPKQPISLPTWSLLKPTSRSTFLLIIALFMGSENSSFLITDLPVCG